MWVTILVVLWGVDPNWVAAFVAVISLIAGLLAWWRKYRRIGPEGHWELRRIYQDEMRQSVKDPLLQHAALAVLQNRAFFHDVVVPHSVGRAEEITEFRRLLRQMTHRPTQEVDKHVEDIFKRVGDRLAYAEHPTNRKKGEDWLREKSDGRQGPPDHVGHRNQVYLAVILLNSHANADTVQHGAANFFERRDRPLQPWAANLKRSGDQAEVDRSVWIDLLAEAKEAIRKADIGRNRVHLAIATPTLWNFALGTLLCNRFALVLYHYQSGSYHCLGELDRRVKDLRSPGSVPLEFEVLNVQSGAKSVASPAPKREAVALSVGANNIEADVRKYIEEHQPGMPLRVVTKRAGNLDPENPDQWIHAAAEIAHLICDSKAEEIYLFADMPAVLGLVVGDSIGPYPAKRIHLMQWNWMGKRYVEIVELPDEELNKRVG